MGELLQNEDTTIPRNLIYYMEELLQTRDIQCHNVNIIVSHFRINIIIRLVQEVVRLDRPGGTEGGSREAALFCAATLHRFGLPVDYTRLKTETLPESCS
jgi:hypothetical protein